MISQKTRGLFAIHYVTQIAIITSLFWSGFFLFPSFSKDGKLADASRYIVYWVLGTGALAAHGLTTPTNKRGLLNLKAIDKINISLSQTIWIAAAIFLFLVAAKDKSISRLFLFTWLITSFSGLVLTNFRLPSWIVKKIYSNSSARRTILLHIGGDLDRLAIWLAHQERLGQATLGILSDTSISGSIGQLRNLGEVAQVERVLRMEQPTHLVVSDIPKDSSEAAHLADVCESLGIRMLVANNLDTTFNRPVAFVDEDGLRLITFRDEPLENPFNRLQKRGLDILVSLPIVLFILPPLSILVLIFQRLQSPGPLFFAQNRAGIQNKVFKIIKFRTMSVKNPDESVQARKFDSRIYPAGYWFRKLSIDEIPQFINVLLGDMSVVGPRPHLIEHNTQWAQIAKRYHIRAFAKPGITGLAQVRGFRGEATNKESIQLRVIADIEYIETWSLNLDLLIIVRTALQLAKPPSSAY